MLMDILHFLSISPNKESVITKRLNKMATDIHLSLLMLETIEFVRKVDALPDTLWALTNRGKKGLGKPTLDMPIPMNNPVMTDEHVMALVDKLKNSHANVQKELAKLENQFVMEEDNAVLSLKQKLALKEEVRARIEADKLAGKLPKLPQRKGTKPKSVG